MAYEKVLSIITIVVNFLPLLGDASVVDDYKLYQFQDEFVPGLFPDYNLCQVFEPPAHLEAEDSLRFVGMAPVKSMDYHVRYVVIHECRDTIRPSFYKRFMGGAWECEAARFIPVLQNCHEEVLFMWSRGQGSEMLPEGVGLRLDSYIMMMVIYDSLEAPIDADRSGLVLFFKHHSPLNPIKTAKRLLLGHQATGQHVLLTNMSEWVSDSVCSGHCTRATALGMENEGIDVVAFDVHTRSLGKIARMDVRYQNGTRYDTPLLAASEFDETQVIRRVGGLATPYRVFPGDDLLLRCHHTTRDQTLPIFGGVASDDELCFALVTHVCQDDQRCPLAGMTSCMSHPTDETLAKAFQFDLTYYETRHFGPDQKTTKKSTKVRFLDFAQPRLKRKGRQTVKKPSNLGKGDIFLSSATTDGQTVLAAIDQFDGQATDSDRLETNREILAGTYVSECSDILGTFSSVLMSSHDPDRTQIPINVRQANLVYHQSFNAATERQKPHFLTLIFIFLIILQVSL